MIEYNKASTKLESGSLKHQGSELLSVQGLFLSDLGIDIGSGRKPYQPSESQIQDLAGNSFLVVCLFCY